ncbi:MAG: transglycosylase SLT domain-containing protein, partial [Bacteroides sp.]
FGLEVNANIDERYHVEKSTRAACQYLKGAYQKYQSWLTAAASYNAGQGRISGELAKQNVGHAADLWLVQETSRYMFRLMAVKMMMENPQQFGFYLKPNQLYPAMDYKVVRVNTQINDLVAFAKQHQISYAQLKEANPWLRGRFLENKSRRTYEVLIPTQQSLHYKPAQVRVHNPAWVVH